MYAICHQAWLISMLCLQHFSNRATSRPQWCGSEVRVAGGVAIMMVMGDDESIQSYTERCGVKEGQSWAMFLSCATKSSVAKKAWKWLSLEKIPGEMYYRLVFLAEHSLDADETIQLLDNEMPIHLAPSQLASNVCNQVCMLHAESLPPLNSMLHLHPHVLIALCCKCACISCISFVWQACPGL